MGRTAGQATALGRVLKDADARVAHSAILENAPLLTGDARLYKFLVAAGHQAERMIQ